MLPDTLDLSAPVPSQKPFVLPKAVSAIQILRPEAGGRMELGLITQLPEGAEIKVGGPGFSEATFRIECQGASYFIFVDDLVTVKKAAASAG
jgi:hypothetical protein